MSAYGAARATTPAAAALAGEGVLYENAFAVSTWTRPSVATVLTSLLPAETSTLNRYGVLDESVPYLPSLFQKAGWKTAAFVGNRNIFDRRIGFRRGFDTFLAVAGVGENLHPRARQVVDPAVAFIDRQTSPHFFLYVHVMDPHLPYLIEAEAERQFSLPDDGRAFDPREQLLLRYDRSIRQADDGFQRIAAAVRRKSWWRKATVVYTADHGEEFFEHAGQGHGRTLHEEQIRVPLIVKWPGMLDAGQRRAGPVSLADIVPTFAQLAGLPGSSRWIGRSLRTADDFERDIYLSESLDNVRSFGLRKASGKLILQLYPKFKQVRYDLAQDPGEQVGQELECGDGPAPDEPLFRSFRQWNARDLAATPSVLVEKRDPKPYSLDLLVNLKGSKPFLRAEDYCALCSVQEGTSLAIRRDLPAAEPFSLRLSADDRGQLPIVRLNVSSPGAIAPVALGTASAPFLITRTTARLLTGPNTDELFRHMRALGYLAGGDHD